MRSILFSTYFDFCNFFFALLALFSCYLNTFEYSDLPDSEVDFGFPGDWKLDHQYTCELSKKLIILKYDILYVITLYWVTQRLGDLMTVWLVQIWMLNLNEHLTKKTRDVVFLVSVTVVQCYQVEPIFQFYKKSKPKLFIPDFFTPLICLIRLVKKCLYWKLTEYI